MHIYIDEWGLHLYNKQNIIICPFSISWIDECEFQNILGGMESTKQTNVDSKLYKYVSIYWHNNFFLSIKWLTTLFLKGLAGSSNVSFTYSNIQSTL